MARKFGKKNVIKIDPLKYNIGLIGESGVGKSTLVKEMCEKLVGEEGYIIAEVGKEDGIDAIAGAIYADIPDWDTFEEFTDDIIENKDTDYKDLKVIAWDTFDELVRIAEPESIRQYNRHQNEKGKKQAKTIKQAWGSFGEGEKYAMNLILDKLWELKKVGVSMFIIGHTKTRTMSDPLTGEDYDILTTNMAHSYFNAIKTKLHFLGVASIDRQIAKEKTGKKDFNNKEVVKGKVVGEARKITFRDDNFNIDSKSRFSDIVGQIDFDVDEFINALNDAIRKEAKKDTSLKGKDLDKVAKEQDKQQEEKLKEELKNKQDEIKHKKEQEEIESILNEIEEFMINNKGKATLKPLLLKTKELSLTNPLKFETLEQGRELLVSIK